MMFESLTLAQKIGQLLVVGFVGVGPQGEEVQALATHISASRVGGVVAYRRNIEGPEQISALNEFLAQQAIKAGLPSLMRAVDQEGGGVQRLNSKNGFSDTPSAKKMAESPLEEVRSLYDVLAANVKRAGFNWNFAPCVDLDIAGPEGKAIGKWGRSYSEDPRIVVEYGGAMIDALRENGCLSCIKHFPGHGSAKGDTHLGFVDITAVWQEKELAPFFQLAHKADAVMTAHVFNRALDPQNPATLSKEILGRLRAKNPKTLIVTDCLQMNAIQEACKSFKEKGYESAFEEAVLRSLNAGVDVIIFANNPQKPDEASAPGFEPGPDLPTRFVASVQSGLRRGLITEARIQEAFERVMELKAKIS